MSAFADAGRGREVGRYVSVDMREEDGLRMVGRATAVDHLREAGRIRTGALLTMLDYVGGLCSGIASLPDGWVVSTNLSARVVALDHDGPLRIQSHVLRRGRNNVVAAVEIRDESAADALVLDGVLTSAILVPEGGPPQWERPVVLATGPELSAAPPIRDWLAVRAIDERTIEIDLADELRNPWGMLHGGVVAMVVDLASDHATGGAIPVDVVLHFLAPNRAGPVRATARSLGARPDGEVVRIEVRDEGAGRTTAVAVATCIRPG